MIKQQVKLRGIGVSPGIAWGRACIFGTPPKIIPRKIRVGQVARELSRLSQAIEMARRQLEELKERISSHVSSNDANIFDAYLLFLNDPVFLAQIQKKLVEQRINVEAAVDAVIQESITTFSSTHDNYLKERIQDIRDVGRRILDNLIGYTQECLIGEESELIIVAPEITPSQAAGLNTSQVKGLITEKGGPTSHAAILARSLGIPLVSGIPNIARDIEVSSQIIMNGTTGEVIINPTTRQIENYRALVKVLEEQKKREKKIVGLPAVTLDGHRVQLMANIRTEEDIELAQMFHAEGIGLYRTEIHFIDRTDYPSEEEQFEHYHAIVARMAPFPVTIRTMDLGGDKFSPFFNGNHRYRERNPYLGLRAIRLSLRQPEIFKQQLRAVLRASVFGKVKILLPMIASVEEIHQVRRLINQAMRELDQRELAYDPQLEIGAMIEIPSAALAIHAILKEVDFISIGTNDLIQYTLAVDRSNAQVSDLYEPLHPAVLHLLKMIADAAKQAGKDVSICGEMAGDVRYTKLLIGLGFDQLSMSSFFIPQVKRVIRSIRLSDAIGLAECVLALTEVKKIKRLIDKESIDNESF
ncbi:MAG: phosphoenolpyruvate--protein phosphotransferase [candidate division KSB1 bacterium]|nr:phosphoenolpyruvate--protein phosphotransferase [candidate division KSB1 bacterium]MDZ7333547.1 phosphoenolpyruvate--protein phosphotransferase [candidate division KSB1 bacterium]MDZ7358187.1 phosphoenolpyruvate--protein phosphotransferase [candidate division KSB1 bacterium]MDZ7398661.1 phosphoenolpyruvate--protein phosphotransferase [candidate division KSB1 bacterium]